MSANAYGKFVEHQLKADIDWDTPPTIKAMICGSGYTPDFDADEYRSDVTSEVSGSGYTAGGITLTGVTFSLDATNHWVKIDANDADFGTVTFTAGTQLILYISTGSAATDILISRHSFTSASPSGVNFTYAFNANGIGYFAY